MSFEFPQHPRLPISRPPYTSTPSTSTSNQLSVVPEEMVTSSVDLVLELAGDTARLADESGDGVSDTAASAMVEIIGQVR